MPRLSLIHIYAVIILPNNKNIIMAAQSACELAETPCAVVPTRSVPEAFAALFGVDEGASREENVESMTEAFAEVKTGEVTRASKDAKDASGNAIHAGDVIGIADGSIDAVGQTVEGVVMDLLGAMDAQDADTLTILAGEDMDDASFEALVARIEEAYEYLEVDAHRGEQMCIRDRCVPRTTRSRWGAWLRAARRCSPARHACGATSRASWIAWSPARARRAAWRTNACAPKRTAWCAAR